MKTFKGKLAVLTGGSTGIGRELAVQLAAEGCNLAICATSMGKLEETKALCEAAALSESVKVSTHVIDVSDEEQVLRFRDEVQQQHATDRVNLLISNHPQSGWYDESPWKGL